MLYLLVGVHAIVGILVSTTFSSALLAIVTPLALLVLLRICHMRFSWSDTRNACDR